VTFECAVTPYGRSSRYNLQSVQKVLAALCFCALKQGAHRFAWKPLCPSLEKRQSIAYNKFIYAGRLFGNAGPTELVFVKGTFLQLGQTSLVRCSCLGIP